MTGFEGLEHDLQDDRPQVEVFVPGDIVPFVRVGRERGTVRAKAYHGSKAQLQRDLALYIPKRWLGHPGVWYVETIFYRSRAQGDGDNLHKAVLDALQGVLYLNDAKCKAGMWTLARCSTPRAAGVHVRAFVIDVPPESPEIFADPPAEVLALMDRRVL